MRVLFKIISILFHPLFVPIFGMLAVFIADPYLLTGDQKIKTLVILFINTVFFPMLVIMLLLKLGFLNDIYMEGQKERFIPYIATSFFFIWAYMVFKQQNFPLIMSVVLLGSSIGVTAIFLANIFSKVSMHTTAMGGLLALTFLLMFRSEYNVYFMFMVTVGIAGLVGTARMAISTHHRSEVYSGYLLGFFSQVIAFIWLF